LEVKGLAVKTSFFATEIPTTLGRRWVPPALKRQKRRKEKSQQFGLPKNTANEKKEFSTQE